MIKSEIKCSIKKVQKFERNRYKNQEKANALRL